MATSFLSAGNRMGIATVEPYFASTCSMIDRVRKPSGFCLKPSGSCGKRIKTVNLPNKSPEIKTVNRPHQVADPLLFQPVSVQDPFRFPFVKRPAASTRSRQKSEAKKKYRFNRQKVGFDIEETKGDLSVAEAVEGQGHGGSIQK